MNLKNHVGASYTGSVVFQFLECLRDNFLYQFIDRPTRHMYRQSSNILDLCLTDKPEIINSIHYCSNLGASDHVSLFISLDCDASYDVSNTVKRNYHKGDYEAIRLELSKINWEIIDNMSTNESYTFFSDKICECVEKYVPIVNPKKMKKGKWMDSDCMKSVKRKYKKWQTYVHTRNRRDFDIFCKARNDCTKTVRNAKRKFEKSIAENMTVNS